MAIYVLSIQRMGFVTATDKTEILKGQGLLRTLCIISLQYIVQWLNVLIILYTTNNLQDIYLRLKSS